MERTVMEVQTEKITIQANGRTIYGERYLPETEEKSPAVIFSHGYNGSHGDFREECRFLAAQGFLAVAYDFCGGSVASKSSGATVDMTLLTERDDLEAVLDYVKGLEQTDPDHIFLLGASQGGMVSALTAAVRSSEIQGMALYYPAFCIPDDWRRAYPDPAEIPEKRDFWGMMLGAGYFRTARELEPWKEIRSFAGKVLIIHGEEDEIVPLSYAVRAKEEYPQAGLVILPGEKHGFTQTGGAAAVEKAAEFFCALCGKTL